MGTMTAQLSVGGEHHGGIVPSHLVWLFESHSRTAWILDPTRREVTGGDLSDRPGAREPITWARSPREHLLEDGLLLMALHALGDGAVLALAQEQLPDLINKSWVALDDVPAGALAELRKLCPQVEFGAKLVVVVLGDSALSDQLQILDRYEMDVEVCTVSYSRLRPPPSYSASGERVTHEARIEGTLKLPHAERSQPS